MQITLKQSEITAAVAAYLTNVLGVSNVTPETLAIVYKQGRADKNGMTAELEIDAPSYERPKQHMGECHPVGKISEASAETLAAATSAPLAVAPEVAPVVAAAEVEPSPVLTQALEVLGAAEPEVPVYDGERRAEEREPEVALNPVAEPEVDEVAQALAEDAAADLEEAQAEAPVAAPAGEALFG